ncbi:MAG: HAMP domain-containing protein [Betaproteobacteria bacterium]|nr:HAMP domain-containing protein [Betaproteobacteria bacterium]
MRRFPLRAKLALLALVLLVLPAAGYLYVREMERFLLAAQEEALSATARAVATALHDRPQLLAYRPVDESALRREAEEELRRLSEGQTTTRAPVLAREAAARTGGSEEIAAILKGVERSSSRVWVVSRDYRVLALVGSLKRDGVEPPGIVQRLLASLISPPTEEFDDAIAVDAVAASRGVTAALQGAAGTRTRTTQDGRAVVLSAAQPIWVGNEVHGAVVVEETTNRIASLRSRALERLVVVTLAAFALVAAVLFWFATRISNRIRRLRDEAEAAIDARGRVLRLLTASNAGDEIGDLSRSFTTVLRRLGRYNAYLEGMAGRLSHELRTPIAVVRSSLENLHAASSEEERRIYVARAEEGLGRLSAILSRMGEASRLEQGLSTSMRERYDAVPVISGCVEGYRMAYPQAMFVVDVPDGSLILEGSADLLAQMLDKLVENAVDFHASGTPIRISMDAAGRLRIENSGPPLPEAIRESLFESMVSQRAERAGGAPHLGLGLYVARLVAEFHGGSLKAENLPDARGVVFEAELNLAVKPAL